MAFPIGWQKVCPLTIAQALVKADSLTDFPILLTADCLPDEMITTGGAEASQANGGDIRFSSDSSGLEQLPCEIVSYTQNASPASATAEIWIHATLSGNADTVIYVWYKSASVVTQPAAGAAFGSDAVWDAYYQFVWHGGDGATLSLADSSGNANTLTNTGAVAAGAGKIGGAGVFGGANYLSKTTPTGVPASGPMTVEAWVKLTDATIYRYALAGTVWGGSAASIATASVAITTPKPFLLLNSGVRLATSAISTGVWTHIASVCADPFFSIYTNGVLDASSSQAQVFGVAQVTIGALDGTLGTVGGQWLGSVDEARISSTTRSPGWLSTQYLNHTSPSTFVVPGTPYAPGAYADTSGYYGRQFR